MDFVCKLYGNTYAVHVTVALVGVATLNLALPAPPVQMLLFPNALCCSLYERNCVCAVTNIFTKFLSANNFCQLLRVTRKHSCTSAGNAQAQLHYRDDQQRAFGISNISNRGGPVKLDSMWQHRLTRLVRDRYMYSPDVQHTYYRIIFKQNPFNIISREVQGCTSTDFRLK